jgi:hypothetical protein
MRCPVILSFAVAILFAAGESAAQTYRNPVITG